MATTTQKVSLPTVALHTILVLITGGLWLIPLVIWYIFNNKR